MWFKAKQSTTDATANGATPCPAPARTAFSFPNLSRLKVYLQFLLLHPYQHSQQGEFLSLRHPTSSPCAIRTGAPPPAPAQPHTAPQHGTEQHVLQRQNSDDYQLFCRQTKLLITNTTPQYSCTYTMNFQILTIS